VTADALRARAAALGFDAVGIADAAAPWPDGARLGEFIALGRHGEMAWLAREEARRAHPTALWPAARSAVMVGLSYAPPRDPMAGLEARDTGLVSAYAARRDYHEVIKGRLKQLGQWLANETGAAVKVFVDTAPLMEKPLAARTARGCCSAPF
jgi:epoxyqueuosine reductase